MKKFLLVMGAALLICLVAGVVVLVMQKPRYTLAAKHEWLKYRAGGGGETALRWYFELPEGLTFSGLKGRGGSDERSLYREITVDPWSLRTGTAKVKAYYRVEEKGKPPVEFRKNLDVPIGETGVALKPAPDVACVITVKRRK